MNSIFNTNELVIFYDCQPRKEAELNITFENIGGQVSTGLLFIDWIHFLFTLYCRQSDGRITQATLVVEAIPISMLIWVKAAVLTCIEGIKAGDSDLTISVAAINYLETSLLEALTNNVFYWDCRSRQCKNLVLI